MIRTNRFVLAVFCSQKKNSYDGVWKFYLNAMSETYQFLQEKI